MMFMDACPNSKRGYFFGRYRHGFDCDRNHAVEDI